MSEDEDRARLEAILGARDARPLSEDDVRYIEEALGHPVPAILRFFWLRFGRPELAPTSFYRRALVEDLLEQYAESSLPGLLPIASDGGSRDYAIDVDGTFGLGAGIVFRVDRGTMTQDDLEVISRDLVEFVAAAVERRIPDQGRDLAELWTERHRDAAYGELPPSLRGLGPGDFAIRLLYYRTSVPKTLLPLRDIVVDGIPCRAPGADEPEISHSFYEVHLDRSGRLQGAILARDHVVGGFPCRAGTPLVLKEDRSPHRFTPATNVTVRGLLLKAGEVINDHDLFYGGVLVQPTVLAGVPCAASLVHLSPDGQVLQATLAASYTVDGQTLPAGTWFERLGAGDSLYRFRLPGREDDIYPWKED